MTTGPDIIDALRAADPATTLPPDTARRAPATLGRILATPRHSDPWPRPVRGELRRVGIVAVAAAIPLAVLLAAAAALLPAAGIREGTIPSAFALRELADGRIEVTIADLADAEGIARGFEAGGIEVVVDPQFASPGAVGHLVSFDAGPDGNPGLTFSKCADGSDGCMPFFLEPRRFQGRMLLGVGVETPAGKDYQVAEEAFDDGEVLAGLDCALPQPMTADALEPFAVEAGFTVEWLTAVPEDDAAPVTGIHTESVAERPDGLVWQAYARNAATLTVWVAPDGVPFRDGFRAEFRPADDPCSAADVRPWRR